MSAALASRSLSFREASRSMAESYGALMDRSAGISTKVAYKSRKVGEIDFDLLMREWKRSWPSKTAHHVAAFLDAPARTAENWLAGKSRPDGEYVGRIYGRSSALFLVAVIPEPPEWLLTAAHREKRELLDRLIAEHEAAIVPEGGR